MPDVYGPFDAAEGEPGVWTQSQWYRTVPLWGPSGVAGPPAAAATAGDLALTVNGLAISIGLGRAHVRGAGYERTGAPWSATVPANTNPTNSRIDRVALRRDLGAKTVTLVYIEGTPAASPAAPALQQVENGQWDIPLFRFRVQPNNSTVLADVADERLFIGPDFPRVDVTINGGWLPLAGYAAQCYITSPGRVALIGRFQNGGAFTPDFTQFPITVPVGYRPKKEQVFVLPYAGGRSMICTMFPTGRLRLDGDGRGVQIPANTNFFLDPIEYDVAWEG